GVFRGTVRGGERARLFWVMVLTGGTMAGEFVGAFLTGSLALLGDAVHMLSHFLAVALSYAAILIALRPAPPDKTYRYWRVEILASLVNGITLLPVAGYMIYKAIERLRRPVEIDALGTLAVGTLGLAVNVACAALLHRHSRHDLNVRGAFLHMLADSASSVGVLVAAGAVHFMGWQAADPLIAVAISGLILAWCLSLLKSSFQILLESVPRHVELEQVRSAMMEVSGILDVHDLHVWTITSRMHALTAHVRLAEDVPVSRTEELSRRLRRLLDERYEINHATFQFEVGETEALRCEHEHCPPAGSAALPPGV
ncbi:MAG: cation diffusion facilitator family transporter, partial [Planctomycetota bacterium]